MTENVRKVATYITMSDEAWRDLPILLEALASGHLHDDEADADEQASD